MAIKRDREVDRYYHRFTDYDMVHQYMEKASKAEERVRELEQAAKRDSSTRIGDAERGAAVSELGEHYAAGRLTLDEFQERSAAALQARYVADLRELVKDLPKVDIVHPSRLAAEVIPLQPKMVARRPSFFWTLFPWLVVIFNIMLITGLMIH